MKLIMTAVLLVLVLLVTPAVASDGIFSLEWSPVEFPTPIRYEVGYGAILSGSYPVIKLVNTGEDYTITGLECLAYFVAVRTCDVESGECSVWSIELSGFPTVGGAICRVPPTPTNLRRTDVPAGPGG